jgi:hypothetical protein
MIPKLSGACYAVRDFTCSMPIFTSVMNFIINSQTNFQIHLYIILIEGISTILIDQMPTCIVFKKVNFMQASKF